MASSLLARHAMIFKTSHLLQCAPSRSWTESQLSTVKTETTVTKSTQEMDAPIVARWSQTGSAVTTCWTRPSASGHTETEKAMQDSKRETMGIMKTEMCSDVQHYFKIIYFCFEETSFNTTQDVIWTDSNWKQVTIKKIMRKMNKPCCFMKRPKKSLKRWGLLYVIKIDFLLFELF